MISRTTYEKRHNGQTPADAGAAAARREPVRIIIRLKELQDKFNTISKSHTVYIDTAWGRKEVTSLQRDYWVRCGRDNGGFGMSFCCHAGTILILEPKK